MRVRRKRARIARCQLGKPSRCRPPWAYLHPAIFLRLATVVVGASEGVGGRVAAVAVVLPAERVSLRREQLASPAMYEERPNPTHKSSRETNIRTSGL